MEFVTFQYNPTAYVKFTGADLALLVECSQRHYDWKCKSLSDKGWLTGLVNMFIMEHDGDLSKGVEFCRENPEFTDEAQVDTRRLDLLMKVLEVGAYMDSREEAMGLSISMKRLFVQLNSEFSRLNPRKEETNG